MSERTVEIKETPQLQKIMDLWHCNPDAAVDRLIQEYQRSESKIAEVIAEYRAYKERELDAFALGDAVSDGICLVDKNGYVVRVNKGYTAITGITEQEVVGHHIEALLEKKLFSSAVSMQVLEQKKKVSRLSTIRGNNKRVLITGNPMFDENEELLGVLSVMRDMTELLKLQGMLEESEQKSQVYQSQLAYYRDSKLQHHLIGTSPAMERIRTIIQQVAATEASVLITGETGVGKEVVASELHRYSGRAEGPFIKVNCAAIPENLLESELFGYEKGAFTGADRKDKLGLFEMANGGTILLDEIGEMPIRLQSKLLRVLQERELTRVGGTKPVSLNVRVIASTNQNLADQIRAGNFREDLYYRLNVIPIQVPPLRERPGDIEDLAQYFIGKYGQKYGYEGRLDSGVTEVLCRYGWPGNVRELQNVIERLMITEDRGIITPGGAISVLGADRLALVDVAEGELTYKELLLRYEKTLMEQALNRYGSSHKAAKALGINQSTVVRRAKLLNIPLR